MSSLEETESLLKRYFPVILKPIVLTVLFFSIIVWLYFVLYAVAPNWFIAYDFPPQIREEEIARAGNLGSFLTNLLQGNFGYSFITLKSVAAELAWRLPSTILLVGLSTVFSLLIGTGLSLLFKSRKQRPSTFAHSLRGFVFGLAPYLALALLFFFGYYIYASFGLRLFPTRGLYSVPPPTDALIYATDVAWHLALPVGTLTVIGVLRILFVIWSSGSTFTKKDLLKRMLLPCTAIDFASTISAVVIVEWIFTLPGIGRLFLDSLMRADLNTLVGAFALILVLALGLGYLSVFLDFIQRLTGLDRNLKIKVAAESEISSTQTKEVIGQYIKSFLRKKGTVIGLVIVLILLVLALFAPFMTPHDPTVREPVAQEFAMPQWMTIFPEFGNLSTTEKNSLYWNVEKGSEFVQSFGEKVTLQYEADGMQTTEVELSADFSYTAIPPNGFFCKFNWTTSNVLDTEYSLRLVLSTPSGEDYDLWVQRPLTASMNPYVVSVDSANPLLRQQLGFQMQDNPAPIIFSQKGEYSILLKIQFTPESENGKCDVSFQDAEVVIPGQVHGIFGTDHVGADIFTQLVYGARMTIAIAFLLALVAVVSGFPLGLVSGFLEGWADNFVTSVVEAVLLLPILPIALVYIFILARSWIYYLPILFPFLFALATIAFRNRFLVRSSNQKLRGTTPVTKILNLLKDFFANFSLTVISVLMLLIAIDFLGFGDPRVPSLGTMLHSAFAYGGFSRLAWWWILSPVAYIGFFALGLLLLGTGLDD